VKTLGKYFALSVDIPHDPGWQVIAKLERNCAPWQSREPRSKNVKSGPQLINPISSWSRAFIDSSWLSPRPGHVFFLPAGANRGRRSPGRSKLAIFQESQLICRGKTLCREEAVDGTVHVRHTTTAWLHIACKFCA